jgi:hypothetical protein
MKPKSETVKLPESGAAFVFPIGDGRFSVVRVLVGQTEDPAKRWKGEVVLAACASWIGDNIPSANDPSLRAILHMNHHAWKNVPCLIWTSETVPRDFVAIGNIPPTADEKGLVCNSFGSWNSLTANPLAQWRWEHDRDAVVAEDAAKAKRQVEERRLAQKQREEYLSRITLSELRDHEFFPRWKRYPSEMAKRASRKIMAETVERLQELGPISAEADRMEVLRRCIESFNELDAQSYFIETVEREDICWEFEAIVHACGLGTHKDLADKWRDW